MVENYLYSYVRKTFKQAQYSVRVRAYGNKSQVNNENHTESNCMT